MKDPLSSTTPARILRDKLPEFNLRLEPTTQPQEPLLRIEKLLIKFRSTE